MSTTLGSHRRERLAGQTALAVGATLAATVTASLIVSGHEILAVCVCGALPLSLAVSSAGLPVLAALVLLLMLDGVPGVNLQSLNSHGAFQFPDAGAVVLIVLAGARMIFGHRIATDKLARWLLGSSTILLVFWVVAFIRGLNHGVPPLQSALLGRDFLFFAILAPLAPWLIQSRAEARRFIAVLGVAAVAYALGEIGASLHLVSPAVLNAQSTLSVSSLTRVYAPMNDLIALTFPFALGVALVGSGTEARMATVVSVITGLAVTLQLTRALYIGLVVGLLVALLLWSRRVVPDARRLRRRFALVTLGTIVSIAATALLAPELLATSAVQAVVDNASQGLASLTGGQVANNTFQYRIGLAQSMIGVLGGHWLFGLGFLHPSTVYFAQLPGGSIRNADVGVLNGVMTMGVLGTLCIYFPVLVGLRATWRAARREDAWSRLALGAMMWLISILVASVTLTTLFSTTGLVLVAVMIGLLVRVSADNTDGRAASSASGPGAI